MIFNEKRKNQYKRSIEKLPFKLRSIKFCTQNLHGRKNRVAIQVAGGLGDYILAAKFLASLDQELENLEVHLFCQRLEIAKWVFADTPQFKIVDIRLQTKITNACYAATINCLTLKATKHIKSNNPTFNKFLKIFLSNQKKIRHLIKHHPALDGYIARYAVLKGENRYTFTSSLAKKTANTNPLKLQSCPNALEKFNLTNKPYITISNGYDVDGQPSPRPDFGATKVYPHFNEVAGLIKKSFPDIIIVQLGNSSSQPLTNSDINLINQTNLKEVTTLLKNSILHIDNEGGLVHLATNLKTKCCVVFGPTDIEYFGYPTNINIKPLECGNCWWMEGTWMSQCVIGDALPRCMFNQPASNIFEKIKDYISSKINKSKINILNDKHTVLPLELIP